LVTRKHVTEHAQFNRAAWCKSCLVDELNQYRSTVTKCTHPLASATAFATRWYGSRWAPWRRRLPRQAAGLLWRWMETSSMRLKTLSCTRRTACPRMQWDSHRCLLPVTVAHSHVSHVDPNAYMNAQSSAVIHSHQQDTGTHSHPQSCVPQTHTYNARMHAQSHTFVTGGRPAVVHNHTHRQAPTDC
jgi:hypothetical protein